jgi:hypothetical protein
MSIPEGVEILEPWSDIATWPKGRSEFLSSQLAAQISADHVLHGVKVTAVAVRTDRDDVLFRVDGAKMPLAVVHMTWHREAGPRWPITRFFESWDHWVREEMLPAHEEHTLS